MLNLDDKRIDVWTKSVAFLAVCTYVFGYVIITIRNADFGFSTSEILKPRVLAAGSTFLVLCFVPSYLANKTVPAGLPTDRASLAKKCLGLVSFWLEIIWLISLKYLVLRDDPVGPDTSKLHWKGYLAIAVGLAVSGVLVYLQTSGLRHINKFPMVVAATSVICLVVQFSLQMSNIFRVSAAANMWLFVTGLFGCWIYRLSEAKRLDISHAVLMVSVCLFGAKSYAELLFPHIYQRWGGGQPTSIAISFIDKEFNKTSEFKRSELLDEDSAGIYVHYADQDVAVFVPKESISRVCFVERTQPHQFVELMMPSVLDYNRPTADLKGCSP